jgi:hypothetical protein
MKMVVPCSVLVEMSVCDGMLTKTGSWWGKKYLPLFYFSLSFYTQKHNFIKHLTKNSLSKHKKTFKRTKHKLLFKN